MVKTDANFWRLFRQSTATGLVLLLTMVGFAPVAGAEMWVKRDWSRVQIVTPGTRTTVVLYKDQAPRKKRKIKGKFHSATPETITLLLPDGQTRTQGKQAVEKVQVYRPIAKRYEGWITAGVIGGIIAGSAAKSEAPSEPLPAGIGAALVALVVGVPTVVVFLVAPKMGSIYYIPPDRRDPANTKTTPPKQRSDNAVPAAAKPSNGLVGPRKEGKILAEEDDLDRHRQQARQSLMRKGLPLDLSSLPVHERRSGID